MQAGATVLVSKEGESLTGTVLSVRQADGQEQVYVHFQGFNKRLDAWVSASQVSLHTHQEPLAQASKADLAREDDRKRKRLAKSQGKTFSKDRELIQLRTSGSLTQSAAEVGRLKNISRISIGRFEVDAWYFAPYPEPWATLEVLCICEFCLEPVGPLALLRRHRSKCELRHPPGNEIYRSGDLSFFEIDGRKQKRYCRNLCLLSKLFLDHKTLYYDVDPFLFYIMTKTDERGMHLVGYFSKEKQSAEDYNVACILTLPQFQRMGFGKLLMQFSYELCKVERKLGSPEKPLSDLGLLSYRSFWADAIVELIVEHKGEISVAEISDATAFTHDDIMHTLQSMDLLKYHKGQFVIYLNEEILAQYEKSRSKNRVKIDPSKLEWVPPKFQPSQLRFI